MWWREYQDYPHDSDLKKETVETGKGIIGCEMHDRQGWGEAFHHNPRGNPGRMERFLNYLFGTKAQS